jgi:ferredoxin
MKRSFLKKIRVVLSIVFFIPVTIILTDFTELVPQSFTKDVLCFQFVPSLLKFISVFALSATGFVLIFVLTFLFGRVYCSTICPLGFFQDVVNYIAKKIHKRKRKLKYLKEQKYLRWILFSFTFILFVSGIALGVNLLDPYSIYGRFSGNLFRPAAIWINNLIASILESMQVYSFYPYEQKAFNLFPFVISIIFFVFIVYLAYKKGRLYCNTVCPVGTILGLVSKISLFKIVIDEEECLSCGACEKDCKGNCIDSKDKAVDMSRCVACFNCISSCPSNGIKFQIPSRKKENIEIVPDQAKRDFIISTGVYFATLSPILAQTQKQISVSENKTILRKHAVSPPGSISIDRFNSKCTACSLCVNSCPTQVLQPSFLEYGFLGMLQPRMDNNAGFCNFDCTICSNICPTGAILPVTKDEKQLIQIGKAKFIKDNCIVKTNETDCGACSEHCPTKAVHMIPYKNDLVIPEVREGYCVGCGACEYACPVRPNRAIYVEGNEIHSTAKKNVEKEKIIGKAAFILNNCIVETQEKSCGICAQNCTAEAIGMVSYKNGLKIPEIKTDKCIGCGTCEELCPSKPNKAIYVEGGGNRTNTTSGKKAEKEKVDLKEDFPF